jgi:hypothetical protein
VTVTATLTGADGVHIAGTVTRGSFATMTLSADLTLTPQFKTFPPKNPPTPCTSPNALKKATYTLAAFAIS